MVLQLRVNTASPGDLDWIPIIQTKAHNCNFSSHECYALSWLPTGGALTYVQAKNTLIRKIINKSLKKKE